MDTSTTTRVNPEFIHFNVPHHRAETSYSCGAAAVRCLAEYYGFGPKGEAAWRKILNTNHDGTTPKNIVCSLRSFGLKVLVRKNLQIEELISSLDGGWPVICPIQAWGNYRTYRNINSGHYVVVIGYDNRNLYFEDSTLRRSRGWMTQIKFFNRWHDTDMYGNYFNQSGLIIKCPWEPVKDYKLFVIQEIE